MRALICYITVLSNLSPWAVVVVLMQLHFFLLFFSIALYIRLKSLWMNGKDWKKNEDKLYEIQYFTQYAKKGTIPQAFAGA